MNKYNSNSNSNSNYEPDLHYPEMINCKKMINGFACLQITYKKELKYVKVTQNNNRTNTPLAIQATTFLTELGIRHGDRQNNLFIYNKNGNDIFFWIDFEAAGFTKNALNSLTIEQKTFAELNPDETGVPVPVELS